MDFIFERRSSDSPFVEAVWRTQSKAAGSFISLAESHWGMVITRQASRTFLTIRGPETKAVLAPVPEYADIFGVSFKLGTFMPHLPAGNLIDQELNLPEALHNSFWLAGSVWQFPDFDNVDTFINRLVRQGLLVCEPIVEAAVKDQLEEISVRSVQRRFLRATGLTHRAVRQIERARQAVALLQQGTSILDTVYTVGYSDQPHMTRSLKYLMGQTPAQIVRLNQPA
jgi:AraC-like DNA-binding protein